MNIYLFLILFLLSAPAMLNATLICQTCSRQACASPIYHCPLGTHCAQNAVIKIGDENTRFLTVKKGAQFNIELPIKQRIEQWIIKPLPKESILEILWQARAKNDPELFIFTFKAKKSGTIDLVLDKIAIIPDSIGTKKTAKTSIAEKRTQILNRKIITIEVTSSDQQ